MKKFVMSCKSKIAAALSLVGLSALAEGQTGTELYNTFTTEAVTKFESFITFMGPKVLVILSAILGIVLLLAAYNWVRKLFSKARA